MKTLSLLLSATLALLLAAGSAVADTPRPSAAARVEAAPTKAPPSAARGDKEPVGRGRGHTLLRGLVNLNQADEPTLELLPGIGPAKARAIVELRGRRPFKKVEDLTRVKGIGRKTFARLKPFLTVTGASTLVEEAEAAADE